MAKELELSQGKVAVVDDEDFRWLFPIKWYAAHFGSRFTEHWYAVTTDSKHYKMHREIMRAPPGLVVDHIDGNGLNNQKSNLRVVTQGQNAKNRRKSVSANGGIPTSRFKGVNWYPASQQWLARIQSGRKSTFIGYFDIEEDAALAYDAMAARLHGEFAWLNFR